MHNGLVCRPGQDFQWRAVPSLLGDSAVRWSDHNAPRLAAALAFYTLLSLAPLLVVVTSIASLIFGSKATGIEIGRQVYSIAGPTGARAISSLLAHTRSIGHGLLATVFGFVILFLGASGALIELRDALNTMWDLPVAKRTRLQDALNLLKERLFACLVVLSIGFFLLVSLTLNLFVSALRDGALSVPKAVLHVGAALLSFIVVTVVFAAIFKFIPAVRLQWVDVIPGAIVTSLLFALGRLLIGLYLARSNFETTYGTAASTTALLIWVYYSSQIFFFGAAFTKVFACCFGSQK